tara:strand:+ start:314425 stop:315042 length:618 start_codon:yes stop_codon:yes gene_type:complete
MSRFNRAVALFSLLAVALLPAARGHADKPLLFNGSDLDNWKVDKEEAADHWTVSDGMIIGDNVDKVGSNLWTKRDFGDYELELEYMTPSPDYDSGVYARGPSHQIQIGISRSLKEDLTACIYAPKDKQGKYPAVSDKIKDVHKLNEWNRLKIVAQGKRIKTYLNGELFVDYETVTMPEKGPIGLQLHGGVHQKMFFRNIQFKELD